MSAPCAACGQPSRPIDGTYLGRRVCRRDACLVYIDGIEAGRLAAIRAEVERALNHPTRGFDVMAKRYQHYADVLVLVPGQAAPYQAKADTFAAQAADCRRSLQENA